MKFVTFIMVLLIFSGCTEKENSEDFNTYFGKPVETKEDITNVSLNYMLSFESLLSTLDSILCQNRHPAILLEDIDSTISLVPYNRCSNTGSSHLIKSRNKLQIHNNSILSNSSEVLSLDSLEQELERHINNKGEKVNFAESSESLIIVISFQDQGYYPLRNTLLRIIKSYTSLTKTKTVRILLRKRIVPPLYSFEDIRDQFAKHASLSHISSIKENYFRNIDSKELTLIHPNMSYYIDQYSNKEHKLDLGALYFYSHQNRTCPNCFTLLHYYESPSLCLISFTENNAINISPVIAGNINGCEIGGTTSFESSSPDLYRVKNLFSQMVGIEDSNGSYQSGEEETISEYYIIYDKGNWKRQEISDTTKLVLH